MGIKRPYSTRMMSAGSSVSVEPNMNYWLYAERINESGDTVNTLYFYNNSKGPKDVIVPNENTELQDYYYNWQDPTCNNSYENLPFYNHTTLKSVDLQGVPFRNNSMVNAFGNCRDLVSVTNIPDSVTNMCETFYGCFNFNQPITIPDGVTDMNTMLGGCSNFNQSVTFPNRITSIVSTFVNCYNFNQPITIPDSVASMADTFCNCSNFNQPITIPEPVTNLQNTFANCVNFNSDITVYADKVSSVTGCFDNTTLDKDVYIVMGGPFFNGAMQKVTSGYLRYYYSANNTINTYNHYGNYSSIPFVRNSELDKIVDSISYYAWKNDSQNLTIYTLKDDYVNGSISGNYYAQIWNGDPIKSSGYIRYYYLANNTINTYNHYGNYSYIPFVRNTEFDKTIDSVPYYAWKNDNQNLTIYTLKDDYVNGSQSGAINNTYYTLRDLPFETGISQTYYSLYNAGYSTTERKDGVLLRDLNIVDPLPEEPTAAISNAWTYVNTYNSRGVKISQLEWYNTSIGGTSVVVPVGHTVLNAMNAFKSSVISTIDMQNVPLVNNSMERAFNNCRNLTSVANIPNTVTSMSSAFCFCSNFNQSITIPSSVTNISSMFQGCNNFNKSITIPDNVTNISNLLRQCNNFNQKITIPNSVISMSWTFDDCNKFNQPVTIPNGVTNMEGTFSGCRAFNQPVTIPSSVTDMYYTFTYDDKFNQPITIPGSVKNMCLTLAYCNSLNQPVTISNGVLDMSSAFKLSCNFNQPVTIPSSVTDMGETFRECRNFRQSVTVMSSKIDNAIDCFYNTPGNKTVYIPLAGSHPGGEVMYRGIYRIHGYNSTNSTINIWSENINNAQLFTRDTKNDRMVNSVQYYAWYNSTKKAICFTEDEIPGSLSYYFRYINAPKNISQTYLSFLIAGYSTTTRKDGVLLKDLSSK